jgi:tagatose 6-phosphate kinase
MILIVNLNLAVDEIVHLYGLTLGEVHRTNFTERLAGGKGVNIARVLKALNEPALLTGFAGGRAGDFILKELQREEIPSSCVRVENESRTCIILDDQATRTQTVINEAGPIISEAELNAFLEHYARLLSTSDMVIITGSLPPQLPTDVYARLIYAANETHKRVLLDTSHKPLCMSLQARPFMVKVNGAEAGEALGLEAKDFDTAARAALKLREAGALHAMVTLGAQGAVLLLYEVECRIKPPRVEARNSVGSGDAVMAALAFGLMRGFNAEEMARYAVAAGAANALRGAGRIRAEELLQFEKDVTVQQSERATARPS